MLLLLYSFYYLCFSYSTDSSAPPIHSFPCSSYSTHSIILASPITLISPYIPPAPPIPPTIPLFLYSSPFHFTFNPPPPPFHNHSTLHFTYPEGTVQQLALPTSLFTKIRDQNAVTLTLRKLANIIKYFFSCFSIIDYCSTGCLWLRSLDTNRVSLVTHPRFTTVYL